MTLTRLMLICVALFAGQMHTLQDKPVVHLRSHQDIIPIEFGGDLVVIANGPTLVHLPNSPPMLDSQRRPWSVEIKNLGPGAVTIVGKGQFSIRVEINRTVQINSNGAIYSSAR
jgi:hypothetical protein